MGGLCSGEGGRLLTGIGLDARGYIPRSYIIEERDILTQHGLEILLAQPLRADLPGVHPYVHIRKSAEKHSDACTKLVSEQTLCPSPRKVSSPMYTNFEASFAAT